MVLVVAAVGAHAVGGAVEEHGWGEWVMLETVPPCSAAITQAFKHSGRRMTVIHAVGA